MFKKAYASVMALFRFGQKAPHSLPLNPNHLRLFGQKTIGDGGFERLADGFFMRRMSDQDDRHRAAMAWPQRLDAVGKPLGRGAKSMTPSLSIFFEAHRKKRRRRRSAPGHEIVAPALADLAVSGAQATVPAKLAFCNSDLQTPRFEPSLACGNLPILKPGPIWW
jgi:hypothetical protein